MDTLTFDAAIDSLMDSTATNGGATVSLNGNTVPATGYMVGGYVPSLIFGSDMLADDHRAFTWEMIHRYIRKHSSFATRFDVFLGGWIDQESGMVYVDFSVRHESRSLAIMDATANEELAIWDLEKGEEIRVA